MRLKMTEDHGKFRKGETVEVGIADGNDLLAAGVAEVSKDMTPSDYKKGSTRRTRGSSRTRSNRGSSSGRSS